MKDIIKSALAFVGPAFALLLLGFTGYQTFTLILAVTGSPIIAAIGLILFEGGMMYWWFVFRSEAEGLPQMALSLMVFVACLVLVVIATALKLGAVDRTVLGVNTPAKIITAAAVIQLAAKLIFPLLHPEVSHAIKERAQEGKIISTADKKFEARVDGLADTYADAKAEVQVARLLTSLNTKHGTRYQLPAGYAPVVIEAQPQETTAVPARQSLLDRMLGRKTAEPSPEQPELTAPQLPGGMSDDELRRLAAMIAEMGRNTQSDNPAIIPLAQPSGQGERPNGPPPPVVGGQRPND